MQFIKNGPDVPEKLLQAHEDGKVVFFCGAGISYPAGLPGFRGLVDRIYGNVGESRTAIENAAFDRGEYDTTISLLENRVMGGRTAVRSALHAALVPDLTLPGATQTHEALLTLGRNRLGILRLITTNFDNLFDVAGKIVGRPPESFLAPLLPVPKKRWDGLVYLHGKLPASPVHPELERLVISSGDFGLAYLTERWAARFVSELFRNHTVCFVGYGLNDPVMRYMMDALAADQQLGEAPTEVYAFGGTTKRDHDRTADEWKAKNVIPILYRTPGKNDHTALHRTLQAWAETYRDGVRGKEAIVARYAGLAPTGSTKQDDFVGRMLWALCDLSGLPAKTFSDAKPTPSLAWLEAFDENRFRHRDLVRFGVTPSSVEDKVLAFSLVARPAPYLLAPWMRLFRRFGDSSPRWDNVMPHIARWLLNHLDDPVLLLKAVSDGGKLQDNFRYFLQAELNARPPRPGMKILWQLLLAGLVSGTSIRFDPYDWLKRLGAAGLTPLLRLELRDMLAPRLRIRQAYRYEGDDPKPENPDARPGDLVDIELALAVEHAHSALDAFKGSSAWHAALPHLLDTATALLIDAIDLLAQTRQADSRHDHSYWQQAAIAEHEQNQKYRDWTVLIELLRDSWVATAESTPERAILEVRRWAGIRYPIFRRFVFFALAERRTLFEMSETIEYLMAEEGWWLWSIETQREAMVLLRSIAPELDAAASRRLQQAIMSGPPREMYRDDTDPVDVKRMMDREIGLRLSALFDFGAKPTTSARRRMAELSARYPDRRSASERDDFPVWSGDAGEWRQISMTPATTAELIDWLRAHPNADDIRLQDDWRDRCRSDFESTSEALRRLAEEDRWPVDRWSQALQAWSEPELADRSWDSMAQLLIGAPEDFLEGIRRTLAWWVKAVGKTADGDRPSFFFLVRKILALSKKDPAQRDDDPLFSAINHPVGLVTEAVISAWFRSGLEDNQGLGEGDFSAIFGLLCDTTVPAYRHGRLLLAQHVISLFRVDRAWTEEHVLPLFDWEVVPDEARLAWTGYLWSPRFYPSLLAAIRRQFLETSKHYNELDKLADNHAGLLTFAAIEGEPFSVAEFRTATATLPESGLVRALTVLTDGLRAAGDKRQEYWRNRVKPYWTRIWPKSRAIGTPAIAGAAAAMAIAAGEEFQEAFSIVGVWLEAQPFPDHLLRQLHEAGHCIKYPNEALAMIDVIVGPDISWVGEEFTNCLREIGTAAPELTGDSRYLRLETMARRHGSKIG